MDKLGGKIVKKINLEVVTVQDCIDNYKIKGQAVILNDGSVVGFVDERRDEAC